ncbi:asparagine synthase (glutamine-hydrolyzing) [Tianweitania sediminis]|uniref:asparagine synthase (glutamine-hydrolyzing) n=1 Tax=Tianweitania sediminis TaxID=1502156 RepID=A0A8J7R105_9HYPH|nr:asparagine synthase (glutamine-hydrolyzing) [Tianweitania sediminis]
MCGITGQYQYTRTSRSGFAFQTASAAEYMSARGPDGDGLITLDNGDLVFAHRRLSIIDPTKRATQPMGEATGRLHITFNGEIYNHRDLRSDLAARGYTFKTASDTEVILNLYLQRGAEAVHALQGMFAFAIFDQQEKTLFVARDPYGIKPFYYSDDGRSFSFASQVKALLTGGVDDTVDPAGIAGFALLGHVPEPFTTHRAIKALPAGHHLTIRNGVVGSPTRFASPGAVLATRAANVPLREAMRATQDAVRASLFRHLEADVPIGLFLSAGLDSAALLGALQDLRPSDALAAITLTFETFSGTAQDEERGARSVAEHYGARHHVEQVGEAELSTLLPAILRDMDQPSVDGINTWLVARAARQTGLKVALSGIGGDELFGGYSTFRTVPGLVRAAARPAAFPGFGKAARHIGSTLMPTLRKGNPKALSLFEWGGTWPGAYLLRRGLFMPHELPNLLGRDFASAGLERLQPMALIGTSLGSGIRDPKLRVAALEIDNYLKNQLLRDADWAGMAHGVEIRTPLVDYRLLQDVAPFLSAVLQAGGKSVLAEIPRKPLPPSLLARSKSGFSIPSAPLLGTATLPNPRLTSRIWARQVLGHFKQIEQLAA